MVPTESTDTENGGIPRYEPVSVIDYSGLQPISVVVKMIGTVLEDTISEVRIRQSNPLLQFLPLGVGQIEDSGRPTLESLAWLTEPPDEAHSPNALLTFCSTSWPGWNPSALRIGADVWCWSNHRNDWVRAGEIIAKTANPEQAVTWYSEHFIPKGSQIASEAPSESSRRIGHLESASLTSDDTLCLSLAMQPNEYPCWLQKSEDDEAIRVAVWVAGERHGGVLPAVRKISVVEVTLDRPLNGRALLVALPV